MFIRAWVAALFVSSLSWGQLGTQLVLTVPVETTLTQLGLEDTATSWIEMISAAKKKGGTLDIEQFYLSHRAGEPLEGVLNAIREAAKAGAKVRLLVDRTFLKNESGGKDVLANTEGIEIGILDYGKIAKGVQHSKFFLVNGTEAFLGSANFDWRALKHIHEIGIRTQDSHVVSSLQAVFERDWSRAKADKGTLSKARSVKKPSREKDLRLVASPVSDLPSGISPTLEEIKMLIQGATKSIDIQTMDYSTSVYGKPKEKWEDLSKLLKGVGKNVQVRLLVDDSKKSQPGIEDLVKAGIEVRAVKIPEHSQGPIPFARLIHSKYIITDNAHFWLGTDNLSKGYFYDSRGVGVVSSDAELTEQLAEVFEKLWSSRYAQGLD